MPALHVTQEIEFQIGRLDEVVRGQGELLAVRRFGKMGRDEDDQLRLALDELLATEQIAQNRQVAKTREFVYPLPQVLDRKSVV